MKAHQLVDLGTRGDRQSLCLDHAEAFARFIEARLGEGTVSRNAFPAEVENRTITAYSHGTLGAHAVQVEMKPSVRVPLRRTDASAFAKEGPFSAQPEHVEAMIQAIADFVEYLSCSV